MTARTYWPRGNALVLRSQDIEFESYSDIYFFLFFSLVNGLVGRFLFFLCFMGFNNVCYNQYNPLYFIESNIDNRAHINK